MEGIIVSEVVYFGRDKGVQNASCFRLVPEFIAPFREFSPLFCAFGRQQRGLFQGEIKFIFAWWNYRSKFYTDFRKTFLMEILGNLEGKRLYHLEWFLQEERCW